MTTAAELERAIATLDDPAPLLVYADWLQEHGDPRGELIAIQCQRERADSERLAGDERALFRRHLATWLGAAYARHQAGELEVLWRRGFVRTVRIRVFDPDARPDPLELWRALVGLPVMRFVSKLAIELGSFDAAAPDITEPLLQAIPPTVTRVELGRARDAAAALHILSIPRGGSIERGRSFEGLTVGQHVAVPFESFVIGKSTHCDLVCGGFVLGGHRNCEIAWSEGRWLLTHVGGPNPIAVNGRPMLDRVVLCHDDRIEPAPGLAFRFALEGEPFVVKPERSVVP